MVYLDYSATTPVNNEVLETFNKVSLEFIGNPNSLHKLGAKSKKLIDDATSQIAHILNVKDSEIIYTSGSSESNNLAIKGICEKYKRVGKHIITTALEHSSIYGPISYLQKAGYEVSFVKLDENGLVDLEDLKRIIRKDTILVSIASVNSETGILQKVEKIGEWLKNNSEAIFHVDMTQSIGKVNISLQNIDLASFSAHKFYGLKGIGVLVKKESIRLEPIIHGGKSTTIYRSGTPSAALIASLAKALRLANIDLDKKYEYIENLNQYLTSNLSIYESVKINSNTNCIPHILNFSLLNTKPETLQHALEEYDIYISTQSACATGNSSKAVMALTNDEKRALSSVRVSISSLTTKEDIDYFLESFSKIYRHFYESN